MDVLRGVDVRAGKLKSQRPCLGQVSGAAPTSARYNESVVYKPVNSTVTPALTI